ncbi:MAG TPA: cysteine--tRNA ligase [Bdellovibrionota bacterium]|nr:cysteine--tRNA ligase [Bdellovibrionota bacterium]
MRPIQLTNTLSGKKEILVTLTPGRLTMYSCGPTVYNLIHIGNLRGGLVADMFYRYFKRVGYDVVYVRNYTDVDDKIINRSHEEKTTAEAIARKYTDEVETDFKAAGMLEPTHKTTVTSHMPEIIALISKIIENGRAYVVDGEVLFAIEAFPGYGKLSHKQPEDLVAGIRVGINDKKKNPLDFALWKPAKSGEPFWDSPWGKGRPGWHIECSAMSSKWLGDQIDVHHGGEDLIFPHHENEIAQSEGASGKSPFVRYWLHHAFLTLSKEKMSKSLGNVFTAREFLTQFFGEFARYLLLSVHYRSLIDFSDDTIEQALVSLQRIYEAKARALEISENTSCAEQAPNDPEWLRFLEGCEQARKTIDDCFANDFNSAGALAALFSLIREFNRIQAQAKQEPVSMSSKKGAGELIRLMEQDIGGILGVALGEPQLVIRELDRIRASRPVAGGGARPSEEEILGLIGARLDARKRKDFAAADQIRKDLDARGVALKDGPSGTNWSYK